MPYADPAKRAACKRRYYERNTDLCKARAAAQRRDPEAERERLREWHRRNPQAGPAQRQRWKAANPEKVAAEKKRYRLDNPGLWAAYCSKRRALKRQAMPTWANPERIARVYELAAALSSGGAEFEVDHIVPLNHPLVCGLHVEANLQVLLVFDNRSKGNRFWPDMP